MKSRIFSELFFLHVLFVSSRCCLRAIIARDDRNKRKLKFFLSLPSTSYLLLVPQPPLVTPAALCSLCCCASRRVRFNFVAVSPCRIFWLGFYGSLSPPAPFLWLAASSPCCLHPFLSLLFPALPDILCSLCIALDVLPFHLQRQVFWPSSKMFSLFFSASSCSSSFSSLSLVLLSCCVCRIRICPGRWGCCSWGQLLIKHENIRLIIVGQLLDSTVPGPERKRGEPRQQPSSPSGPARFASKWRHFHLVVPPSSSCCCCWFLL